jgi:FAD/FMN-containing dehydrogenase
MSTRPSPRDLLVSRRSVLLGLGSAALAACSVQASTSADSADLTEKDWQVLRARLGSRLSLPTDATYGRARIVFNPLFDGRRPAGVAACTSADDVQACIAFARAQSLALAARSGGHSYAGYSAPDNALVVDLRLMNQVVVSDDGTAVIGAGTRLIDVYAGLAAAGRCLPGGSCPSVGISGLTLGGGIGVLARLHGLTCDALVGADVVLADGTRKSVSAESDPDIFWALRGGGGGNFGVVTSFKFAVPPAPSIAVFSMPFPPGSATEVLGAWQEWIAELPNELWSNCVVSAGRPPACRVGGSFVGSEPRLAGLLDDLVRRAGVQPVVRRVSTKSYMDAMRYFGGCSTKTVGQCHIADEGAGGRLAREAFVASSRILDAPLADPGTVSSLLAQHQGVDLLFDSLGGAVGAVAPDATAFPHRDALASVQVYKGTTPANRAAAVAEVGEIQTALAAIVGQGAYINYIDPNQKDWARASYGDNLARLQRIAQTVDPDGLFAFAQAVRNG